jgi:hypothetical protein
VLVQCVTIADAICIQGTLPFMSVRLLKCWDSHETYEHTATDDLESFVWVLVWCILCTNGSNTKDEIDENRTIKTLHTTNITSHINVKRGLLWDLWRTAEKNRASPMVQLFGPFLKTCENIIDRSSDTIASLLEHRGNIEASRTLTYEYFGEFIAAGAEYLTKLPTSWPPGSISTFE